MCGTFRSLVEYIYPKKNGNRCGFPQSIVPLNGHNKRLAEKLQQLAGRRNVDDIEK
jgi:hypothetical protein